MHFLQVVAMIRSVSSVKLALLGILLLCLVAPWGIVWRQSGEVLEGLSCDSRFEFDRQDKDGPRVRSRGHLLYEFDTAGKGIVHLIGTLSVTEGGETRHYSLNRVAEIDYRFQGERLQTVTRKMAPQGTDDAPQQWLPAYVHPIFDEGARYYTNVYRLSPRLIAIGPMNAPRHLCKLTDLSSS